MTQPLTIDIPHSLGKDEARQRVAAGFGRLREQITGGPGSIGKFEDHWEADCLHYQGTALGQKLTGRIDVGEQKVRVQLDLPEFLSAIADRIRRNLQEQGRKLLEK